MGNDQETGWKWNSLEKTYKWVFQRVKVIRQIKMQRRTWKEGSLVIFCIAWEVPKYGAFSGPYFPVFQSECGKIRTGKTSVFGHFLRSADFFLPSNARISVTKAFLVVSLVFLTFRVYTSRQYGYTTFVCSSKLVHLGSKNLICFNLQNVTRLEINRKGSRKGLNFIFRTLKVKRKVKTLWRAQILIPFHLIMQEDSQWNYFS